jgi:outer membrane protein insertion porin family
VRFRVPLRSAARAAALSIVLTLAGNPVGAQEFEQEATEVDSIAVEGLQRSSRQSVLATANVPLDRPISFRTIQRAITALYQTGQFDSVTVYQANIDGQVILRMVLKERPLLTNWTVRGAEQISERKVRGRVRLLSGLPYDPASAARSRAAIDSLYQDEGYFRTAVDVREVDAGDGTMQVVFDIVEGRRVTLSQVTISGNEQFADEAIVGRMDVSPEGFWWFQSGRLDEDELDRDIRLRLPEFYAAQGYVDFQVVKDSLIVDRASGKAALLLEVSEGPQYQIGSFEVVGNRQFATRQIERLYPFPRSDDGDDFPIFNQEQWQGATGEVQNLYYNNGYIYAQIQPIMQRRTTEDGEHLVDLRWQIAEQQPAIVNKIEIRGNTHTHEDVIRRAIVMVPGDVLRQSALIRSYQTVSNLGFFEQPLPVPATEPANQQGDVNVIFNVEERHTGNINFGATVGQGTGLGGFIGLQEPNLFGRAKQVSVQWQFGRNINDINVSYTDPALRGSLISGTVSANNSRIRYTVADLGVIRSRGASIQFGFPLFGSRFSRILTGYSLEQQDFDSPRLASAFICENCVLSTLSVSIVRDTRIDLPFPSGGLLHQFTIAHSGGPLGGTGNFRRATFNGRWYTPLAFFGGQDALSAPIKVVFGLGAQAGFVWGDAGPHFRQLFAMGGTQFGIQLRGYEEFSVTPQGFDARATGATASTVDAFGGSYFQATAELGLRLSQAVYFSTFVDGGNVWTNPGQFNPTRLFRGAGLGVSLVTPLGPIGIDYAYGFDRTDSNGNPNPGWKFHFKLGNFF